MAARLAAGDNQDVDAGLGVLDGMLAGTGQGADGNSLRPGAFEHDGRRHPERIDDQLDGMREGDLEQLRCAGHAQIIADIVPLAAVPEAARVDIVLLEQVGDEALVLPRHARPKLVRGRRLVLVLELVGNQHVNAVGLALDVIVDPAQLLLQDLWRQA